MNNNSKLLVFIFSLIISLYYIELQPNCNTASRAALPLSIALEGSFNISTYKNFTGDKAIINGIAYSDKAPLSGFILAPIIKIVDLFFDIKQYDHKKQLIITIIIGAVLFSIIPLALIILLTYNNNIKNNEYGTTILFSAFFGSFIFVYSGGYWSHVFSSLLVICSIIFIKKEYLFIAGLLMGAAFMNEYSTAILGVVWGVWFLIKKQWKKVLLFSLGVVPFIILQGWYNNILTGNPLELAYKYQENFPQNSQAYGFTAPSLTALFHLSISQYRRVLFYAPILILIPYSLIKNRKFTQINDISKMIIVSSIIFFLMFIFNKSWYGGWAYGPRYLTVIVAVLFYQFLNLIKLQSVSLKISFILLSLFGIISVFFDKATILHPRTDMNFPLIQGILPAFYNGNFNNWHIPGIFGIYGLWPNLLIFILFFIFVYILHKRNNPI